jgi:hypothetical protein
MNGSATGVHSAYSPGHGHTMGHAGVHSGSWDPWHVPATHPLIQCAGRAAHDTVADHACVPVAEIASGHRTLPPGHAGPVAGKVRSCKRVLQRLGVHAIERGPERMVARGEA